MDEHEKAHPESFFRCQSYFLNFSRDFDKTGRFSEKCYRCQTCQKPFARLEAGFLKLFEALTSNASNKYSIPMIGDLKFISEYRRIVKHNDLSRQAHNYLRSGIQLMDYFMQSMSETSALSQKLDASLLRSIFRSESRIFQYPSIYNSPVFFFENMAAAVVRIQKIEHIEDKILNGGYVNKNGRAMVPAERNPAVVTDNSTDIVLFKAIQKAIKWEDTNCNCDIKNACNRQIPNPTYASFDTAFAQQLAKECGTACFDKPRK